MGRVGWMMFAILCVCVHPRAAVGQLSVIQGPVEADVRSVTDGDTLRLAVYAWTDELRLVDLRVRGVDTPEIRGKCQYEKDLAQAAKTFVSELILTTNKRVKLTLIGCNAAEGAGFGRCLGNVYVGSTSVADALIAAGFARPNFGEPRLPWCPAP
jgi:endonuclease YncB( thermonuclease family)